MLTLACVILLLPLIAALCIMLMARENRQMSASLSVAAVVVGFILSCILFFQHLSNDSIGDETSISWLKIGALQIGLGVKIDSLNVLMLLVVSAVAALVHIYSKAYMAGDEGYSRYFATLSFFTFSMFGIVLSAGFLQMFLFWEWVGFSSYLLIGFWFEKPSAADASKKAFLTNRLGDFGFLIGIMMVWQFSGSLNFSDLKDIFSSNPQRVIELGSLAGLLIFCGAIGKSAQFPLHVWLPDAMEGPTPVSALIHAATMVAAGVFMLCRVSFLFTPDVLMVMAWVGVFTALLAAIIAMQQDDIKQILAHSTLSQLGFMVMAVGVGAPSAAMFHLSTHAFFKALLFLAAGSMIYTLHHRQDIWQMGGLAKRMPTTYWTFLIGALALCGVFPLSGFFSKDAILASVAEAEMGGILFGIGIVAATFTTFYMGRLFLVAFHGKARSAVAKAATEAPPIMQIPLILLAGITILIGFFGIESFVNHNFQNDFQNASRNAEFENSFQNEFQNEFQNDSQNAEFENSFQNSFQNADFQNESHEHKHALLASAFGFLAILFGASLACSFYWKAEFDPIRRHLPCFASLLQNRFYIDACYAFLISATHERCAKIAIWLDRQILDGTILRGFYRAVDLSGKALRRMQTGNLQTYAFLIVLGIAVLIYFVVGRDL